MIKVNLWYATEDDSHLDDIHDETMEFEDRQTFIVWWDLADEALAYDHYDMDEE